MHLATDMRVPFIDLRTSNAEVADELLADFAALIDSGAFTNGPQVEEFEQLFARYCGTAESIGVGSGLAALRLALQAVGVGPGDEVILPAFTFVATAEAVSQVGARPALVDILDEGAVIDPAAVAAAVTIRTAAVIPVHLYGQMADMRAIGELAAADDLHVIADACQAHGAARDGLTAGSSGDAAAFSFYPGKNLGAFGDAGALSTDDPAIADQVRALREHGQRTKYHHDVEGDTARLDTMQALVLLRKLPLLNGWNEQRRRAAALYAEELEGVGDLRPAHRFPGSSHVWHLYVVRTKHRDDLASHLLHHGIGTGRHYPQPVHLAGAYARLGLGRGAFPVSERWADECLSLPMFPGITEPQLTTVCNAVAEFFDHVR